MSPHGNVAVAVSCVGVVASLALGPQEAQMARLVGNGAGNVRLAVIRYDVRSHGQYLEQTLLDAAATVRVPVGLERVRDASTSWPQPGGMEQATTLTGLALSDAFAEILAAGGLAPGAASGVRGVSWVNGVAEVSVLPPGRTFLDTEVPAFHLSNATIQDALEAVHRLLDGTRKPEGFGNAFGPAARQFSDRRFSLTLGRTTVRALLDAIVVAHGDASWVVRYRQASGDYAGCEIGARSFEGVAMTTSAR